MKKNPFPNTSRLLGWSVIFMVSIAFLFISPDIFAKQLVSPEKTNRP